MQAKGVCVPRSLCKRLFQEISDGTRTLVVNIRAPGALRPIARRIAAMNVSEQAMALEMIPQLAGGDHLPGDGLYDINKIYDAAGAVGHQLLAPRKKPKAGFGKHAHSPYRLRGPAELNTPAVA